MIVKEPLQFKSTYSCTPVSDMLWATLNSQRQRQSVCRSPPCILTEGIGQPHTMLIKERSVPLSSCHQQYLNPLERNTNFTNNVFLVVYKVTVIEKTSSSTELCQFSQARLQNYHGRNLINDSAKLYYFESNIYFTNYHFVVKGSVTFSFFDFTVCFHEAKETW